MAKWSPMVVVGLALAGCSTAPAAVAPTEAPTLAPTVPPPTPVPIAPSQVPTEPSQGTGGSAVVVFVKDGNALVWDETTGQSQTIFDSSDVIRVELSDDAQFVAFLRRSYFAAGGYDQNEQSALWVVGRDGSSPRELVSASALRGLLNAAEPDSTNFPRLDWIPDSHRLLFSGNTYEAHGYGEGAHTPLRGVYLLDVDALETLTLASADTGPAFSPSPDGRQIALIDTTGLVLVDAESAQRRREFSAGPIVGNSGWFAGAGVWTQDSTAFVVNALVEPSNTGPSKYELWRVPVDGTPASRLTSFEASSGSVVYAPDGSSAALLRSATMVGPSVWVMVPLPEDLGPLAVPRDTFDYSHLTWSPGSSAYVLEKLVFDPQGGMHGRENLLPLCPNAVQAVEVCGPAIHLGEQIEWLEWVDRVRFLYVTYEPRRLFLGSLDGPANLIADDPPSFDAAAGTCTDDSEFVTDVTVPDGTHFAPGTVFQKTWRIRNSGTCTWDAAYRFGFLARERMSGPRTAALGGLDLGPESLDQFPIVRPGEEIDLTVILIAPEAAGTHRGQWTMFASDGTPFGTRPFVQIQVP